MERTGDEGVVEASMKEEQGINDSIGRAKEKRRVLGKALISGDVRQARRMEEQSISCEEGSPTKLNIENVLHFVIDTGRGPPASPSSLWLLHYQHRSH
jgi:hypothetical protein